MAETNAQKAERLAKEQAEAEAKATETETTVVQTAPAMLTIEQVQALIDAAVNKNTETIMAGLAKSAEERPLPEVVVAQTAEQKAFLEELVPVKLFKDKDKYKDDVTVIVNGKTWLIQRGVQVMVPRMVAMALDASDKQESETSDLISAYQADFSKKMAALS